jgi:hypothetical protein
MNNPYDIHSLSKYYREETLREAQVRHLAEQARRSRAPRSLRDHVSLAWRSVLSVARTLAPSG